MASHTHSGEVHRLDVVETGRRRRWSEDEKLRIVTESFNGPRLVSATARRHGIFAQPVVHVAAGFSCRGDWIRGRGSRVRAAMIIPETGAAPGPAPTGRMEIVVAKGRRIIVDADVDAAALARVIAVLDRR